MRSPETADLLRAWEQGAAKPLTARGLLLMGAMCPEHDSHDLARLSIGQRDRRLLMLRQDLFGPDIQCVTECPRCGEAIELAFRTDEVCVPHGEPGRSYHAAAAGYDVWFRLPDSTDLLALEQQPSAQAERHLVARCALRAQTDGGDFDVAELPPTVMSAVSQKMSEADPQAEIVLDVSCPACSRVSPAPFDIVSHLWLEIDAWARRLLRDVHALAMAYGWSETAILQMSATRRRAYLELIGSQD